MKTLTKNQLRCLDKLNSTKWQTAYELRENLNTLNALHVRGLVISKGMFGCYFTPRTALLWKLKTIWKDSNGE